MSLGLMPSSFRHLYSQRSDMSYLLRTSAFEISEEKSPFVGLGCIWVLVSSCSMGILTVRVDTRRGVSSPCSILAYRVGRLTPRNFAASEMERCVLPSSASRAAEVSMRALRALLRARFFRIWCVFRQVSEQYFRFRLSVVNALPQQGHFLVTGCISFTTFRQL